MPVEPIFGFLWPFTAGGGPSEPTGPPISVNLLTSSSIELFPPSIADREKFRVYETLLGPIVGDKPISNELNARRSQLCKPKVAGAKAAGAVKMAVAALAAAAQVAAKMVVAARPFCRRSRRPPATGPAAGNRFWRACRCDFGCHRPRTRLAARLCQ
jgi:hypothetical protein